LLPAILLARRSFHPSDQPRRPARSQDLHQITGAIGHSGHEYGGRFFTPPSPLASVTHHDRHHQHFRCNYATHFTLWDWLMGTLDDRPVGDTASLRER
jgi:hypothetical protein